MVPVRVSPRGRNSFTKTQEAIIKALRNDSVYTKLDDERKSNTAKEYLVGFEVKINGYNGELFCNYETVKDEHDDIDTSAPINAVIDLLAGLNICGIPIHYEYLGDEINNVLSQECDRIRIFINLPLLIDKEKLTDNIIKKIKTRITKNLKKTASF